MSSVGMNKLVNESQKTGLALDLRDELGGFVRCFKTINLMNRHTNITLQFTHHTERRQAASALRYRSSRKLCSSVSYQVTLQGEKYVDCLTSLQEVLRALLKKVQHVRVSIEYRRISWQE